MSASLITPKWTGFVIKFEITLVESIKNKLERIVKGNKYFRHYK